MIQFIEARGFEFHRACAGLAAFGSYVPRISPTVADSHLTAQSQGHRQRVWSGLGLVSPVVGHGGRRTKEEARDRGERGTVGVLRRGEGREAAHGGRLAQGRRPATACMAGSEGEDEAGEAEHQEEKEEER